MNIAELKGKSASIETFQSTWLKVKVEEKFYRIDFDRKQEFGLKSGIEGKVEMHTNHPILADYNEPVATTYINSCAPDVEELLIDIRNQIDSVTLGFRKWTRYVTNENLHFTLEIFKDNLKHGRGKILEAPVSVAKAVEKVCASHGVLTKSFESDVERSVYRILTIGKCYIVAQNFRVTEC